MDAKNKNILLQVNSIHKTYAQHIVLKNVSFSVTAGKIVGIVGPNGSGKSTLANIILGFDSDYQGKVTLNDTVRIAYVPQFSNTDKYALPLSVYEFIRSTANKYYGLKKTLSINKIKKTLEHVGLNEQHLHQNIYSLSGGERQRAFIARELLNNPNFLVLDEPFASVDYMSRGELYSLLQHLNQIHDITMILISHDIDSVINICNSVFYLNKGVMKKYNPANFRKKATNTQKLKKICNKLLP